MENANNVAEVTMETVKATKGSVAMIGLAIVGAAAVLGGSIYGGIKSIKAIKNKKALANELAAEAADEETFEETEE